MLESWVAWVVNSYVGEYVGLEHLNTDQLSVALVHGSVVLENLPLRKDALRKLDLPIEVKSGFIGQLTIKIPVTNLRHAPWEIQIKKLYLVAGTQPNPQYDEEEAKTSDLENKKKQLAALEDQWKAQHQQQSYSFWYSLGSSLLNKAITNIQINIEDVHIRYEDSTSLPGTTFALGITMDKFSLASTDQKWSQKHPTKETPDVVRKLGKLEGFAVYWDTEAQPLADVTPAQLEEELQKARTKAEAPDIHSYIICPVSAEARVWQNHSALPLRSRAMPRFQCEIQLDDLPISLNQTQFKCMMGLLREFDRYSLARKYRKGRPTEPVMGNCRQWWQFAIRCHLQSVQQRHHRASWQYVLQRARDNVQYVDLYSVHLTSPQTLSEEDKAIMNRIESELSIDELRILVEIAMERCQGQMATQTDSQAVAPSPGDDQQQAWGYMSSWFPGWAQWYTSPQGQTVQEDIRKQVSQEIEPVIDEEEILALVVDSAADNTLLRRDLVFARLDFCLKKGSVTLLQAPSDAERLKVKPILEISCSAISLGMELRPRFSSNLLSISLGALRIQDRTTEDTIFPCLLAPQCTEGSQGIPRQFGVYSRAGPSSYLQQTVPKPSSDDPLFNLVYEQKPLRSQADHRLEVTSRAMVIVYNSTAMHKIAEFFRSPHKSPGLRSQPSETQLTQLAALARTRYEQLKTQTQAEIRQTLDQLLEGESQGRSAVWDVRLDISAPQFLVPQNFTDKSATMVVFDFGHLSFSNHKDKPDEQKDNIESDIDEEDFVTPLSTPAATPPNEPVTLERFVSVQQELSAEDLSEQALHEKLYERYKVGFSDLQVMVVKGRDNWRHAHSKGTSHMHVIDRFSISLRMERRLVYTSDPQWPNVTLAGNLPKLGLHVSEQKVHALLACMKALGGDEPSTPSPDLDPIDLPSDMSTASTLQATLDLSRSPSKVEKTGSEVMREILEESRLLLTEFSVDSMSVDVQSRSRSVAELQVSSVQACITKRPYDTSMTLTVHSLLLVDALQTFGPDFELLIASHKDLCMDVHGGSLVDSDHASSPRNSQDATSTQAPDRAASPVTTTNRTTSPPPGSLGTSPPNLTSDSPFDLSTSALSDTDALITMEFTQINPDCPTLVNGNGGPRQIASLQFNTLDVIANPETVMELLGFFQRVVPKDRAADTKPIPEEDVWSEDSAPQSDLLSSKTQITADFNRLNILVLRAVPAGLKNVGYKVATATMSGAHVMTTLGGEKEMEVEGSLDGLQFLDLTPEGSRHKKVFTMGHDPTSLEASLPDRGQEAMLENASFITACGSSVFQDFTTNKPKALHFTLTPSTPQPLNPPLSTSTPGPSALPEHLPADNGSLRLQLRLASACYTHSPRLLQDLSLCADQFTQYTATWANSLRSAASEMALSFVKKSDPLSMSVGPTGLWDSSRRLSRTGSYRGLNRADSLQQINRDHRPGLLKFESLDLLEDLIGEAETPARRLELDIVLQTPIVVLPRSQQSQDKMVAHLGQISIRNTRSLLPDLSTTAKVDSGAEHFHVEIRDMNMYSFNGEQQNRSRTSSATSINLSSLQEPSTPDCSQYMTDRGTPILHNTTLQLTLVKGTVPRPDTDGVDTSNQAAPTVSDTTLTDEEQNPCLKVSGKLVSPLKLVLSKSVYEQVMETVDNLTANGTSGSPGETRPEENTQAEVVEEEGEGKPPTSVSALKLEEPFFKRDRMASAAENSEDEDPPMVVHGSFDMPELTVQLSGDLSEGEQGLVDLSFQNLKATYVKDNPHTTSIKISLRGLLMEDLLQPTDSKHRQLMVSYPKRRTKTQSVSRGQPVYISTSLPTHPHLLEHVHMPSSLPATLDSNLREYVEVPSYPATPPPSPQRMRSQEDVTEEETEESLVYINILLVDKNSPEFATKYNRVNRFVDVDFSCLDTTINLQTWVVLLDFFGIGSPKEPAPSPPAAGPGEPEMAEGSAASSPDAPEQVNTEVEVKVRSLSLLLNKPEYELAKANVAQLSARVSLVDGNMAVTGNLGSMSVLDLTPHGALYRERFVTSGKEALDFNIFRYGLPDPHLQRDYDIRVRLRMSSVRYVLTQRFQAETVAFCQHFKHLQELLGTMRAATSGQTVNEAPGHAARILMDISAGAPVILFPESSRSSNILVMNLGHLTVFNRFLFAGDRGTIEGDKQKDAAHQPSESPSHNAQQGSAVVYTLQDGLLGTLSPPEVSPAHKCLLDCMEVELLQMDLYSAERVDWYRSGTDAEDTLVFPSFIVERKGGHPLQERCVLKLRVERNLDGEISHDVPDFNVLGMLSSVYCSLDLNQYQLVRGILHCNLGEPLEEFERPPTATQEPSIQTVLSGNVWTGMSIQIDLVNVSIELLLSHAQQDKPAQSLARFEFIRSKLSYESFSDQSKDVDLVSHAIVAHDTRFKDQPANLRPNVFEQVLEPSLQYHQQGALQMELHYRSTKDFTRFTILLNNMRLMVIFDWLSAVKDFLLTDHQEAQGDSEEQHTTDDFNPPSPQPPQPVSVTQGVVTKRGPPPKPEPSMTEIKLNVTQTEFVVVESTASWDTNAIIIKSTAVLTYRPQMIARPVSCSLQSLEVFSCQLGNEQDTALSIIDPLTVNIELKPSANQPQTAGLLDATSLPDMPPMLEVVFQTLNIRVSYHDIRLFLAILNSLPKQTSSTANHNGAPADTQQKAVVVKGAVPAVSRGAGRGDGGRDSRQVKGPMDEIDMVQKLQELGFAADDCRQALQQFDMVQKLQELGFAADDCRQALQQFDMVQKLQELGFAADDCRQALQQFDMVQKLQELGFAADDCRQALQQFDMVQKLQELGFAADDCRQALQQFDMVQKLQELGFAADDCRQALQQFDMVQKLQELGFAADDCRQALQQFDMVQKLQELGFAADDCRQALQQFDMVQKLQELGFAADDCRQALQQCENRLNMAANIDMVQKLQELGFAADDCRQALQQCENRLNMAANIDMVQKLQELGFAADDCRQALQQCENRLNMAAAWLLENAEPVPQKRGTVSGDRQEGGMRLSGIMVTANCACLCLIDDCKDSDVPLAEVALHELMFVQYLEGLVKGSLNCALTVDYYNRELSGWEPLVEPWKSQFGLTKQPESDVQPSALQIRITAEDRLNLNITSSFLDQYTSTQKNWTEDYLNGQTVSGAAPVRRRSPFVPYLLRNHTGCQLSFATQTTSSSRAETLGSHGRQSSDKDSLLSDWHQVMPGEDVPFEFEGRGKLRHRHTHELRVHQLVVQVEGWHQVSPVSVDRVGVYFRDAQPLRAKAETIFHDLPPARIVFAVTMVEGSAQKVVTVRSALVIKSMLEVPTELKLDNPSVPDGPIQLPVLEPNSSLSVPLPLVSWRLYARPRDWGVQFCKKPLEWMKVLKGGERLDSMRECSAGDEGGTYRFCVSVRREHFPPDVAGLVQPGPGASQRNVDIVRRPGHVIRLLPPVVLTNLLPVELSFYLKGTDIRGTVKAGKSSSLYNVDTTQTLELGVLLESFTECRELVIPLSGMSTIDHKVKLRLFDTRNRPLHLYVRLKANPGGTLRILISAPYWLINKTGLPLIFKQEGMRGEAAGQFDEHELARSLAPLLFSYTDKENPDMCTMRLGTAVHTDGMSSWCQRLSLEGGTGVRQLYVVRHGGHPSIVYNIGVDIRRGRGRYHATRIVTFAPRYILDNRTEHKLAFAQRHLARGMHTSNPEGYLSALPKANVLFHWPRVDLDMLLCVRIMDMPDCCWSGGFSIERIGSFHVNMRGNNCRCIFLHAEIVQHGATFCVVFTDPTGLPPPYRIDNLAEVPIVFWQKDSVDDSLRTEMKPHTSMAYARDELILPSVLVCQVKGGSYAYYNMNRFGDGDQLCYENFIYIAFTETFRSQQDADQWADKGAMASRELVLDVPSDSGNAVVLRKKEPGKRSQLWRMTSAGLLRHEGSSPPRHPGSSTAPSKAMDGLVLDITDIAANPLKFITLCLRKPDQRRKATQTWNFTEDGRLCCLLGGLCVQAKDGVVGLRHSAAAVLGPVGITQPGYIPPGQRVTRQKVQPGSGVLACRIMSDGPTRVLQIADINQKRLQQSTVEDWIVIQDQTKSQPLATSAPQPPPSDPSSRDLELEVMLKGGLGISLVNRTPEELAFISLCGISVSYSATASRESLIATVNKIQVDNQLSGSCWPVMLYMSQCGLKAERERPAVHMAVEKEPSTRQDTEIYKHLMLHVSPLVLQLEESGLLKLLQFFGFGTSAAEMESVDVAEFDSWRNHTAATTAKRYYFETLKLHPTEMKLSVNRGAKLPPDLKALKARLGLTLISFQEATVDLDAFTCLHAFETRQFLIDCIYSHYIEELKGQAAKILGSVDFLGNPIGLFNDVTDGLSGLVQHGNVSGLFRNVTHGLSNSAAKMTSALSDGLGNIALDSQHQQTRTQIRQHGGSGSEHIVAGLKGLGFGIVGGLTSLVTQTAEGAVKGGVEGFFSGLGKGIVGTVTRPATGLLDFASGTALAVRDTAASDDASRLLPRRVRLPRCCSGPGGTLPRYTDFHSQGQDYLYRLNDMNTREMFISLEQLRHSDRDFLQGLVSSEAVYFLGRGGPDPEAIILQVNYSDLFHCIAIKRIADQKAEERHYVEVTMKADNLAGVPTPSQNPQKRPVVRCDSKEIAEKVVKQIMYAKSLYDEHRLTLPPSKEEDPLDWDY
ncbi:VPS13D [Branchiostoma lanceolatum]|uniref:VPS13D protein n=1 Tax=Branchiostoma lanceolatum TaxID=7740 RepID=A0A8J9W7Z2_BRALA|nr:VPS13D [Branchiostoma lanceolatum]